MKLYFVAIVISLKLSAEKLIANKYSHSIEELELTKIVKINQNKCRTNQINIYVHSAATSSGKYYDRRQMTRQTWVKDAEIDNMNVIFVLGEPRDDITQKQLIKESDDHKDILQFAFIDDYYNLTLKAIALLQWISNNCLVGDYIVKSDDDLLVNTKRLRKNIDNKVFKSGITGKLHTNGKPDRNQTCKWYMPEELYPLPFLPTYVEGAFYIMTTDIIVNLYKSAVSHSGPVLRFDDMYITGFIAEKLHLQRYESSEMYYTNFGKNCEINVCKMYTISSFYGCESVDKTLKFWKMWKQTTYDSCEYFIDQLYQI